MFDVNVRINLDGVRNRLNAIQRNLGDRAIVSALNKTATQAKTQMSTAIRQDYNISAALMRERLVIRKATRKGSVTFTASLIGNPVTGGGKRSMNLVHFLEKNATAKAFKRGRDLRLDQLRFKVRKSGGKGVLPGAFIGNKGRTVFIRTGKARLPIKAVRTIGVPQMFNTKKNIGKVLRWIEINLPRIAQAEVAYYLSTVK